MANSKISPAVGQVRCLDHLNLTVKSLDAALSFYRELFGFVLVETGAPDPHPWAIIRSGDAMLCLYEHPELREAPHYPTPPNEHGVRHFGLRVENGPAFCELVREKGVELAYGGPVRWLHSTSYYLSDPSGHQIEVVSWDEETIVFDERPSD